MMMLWVFRLHKWELWARLWVFFVFKHILFVSFFILTMRAVIVCRHGHAHIASHSLTLSGLRVWCRDLVIMVSWRSVHCVDNFRQEWPNFFISHYSRHGVGGWTTSEISRVDHVFSCPSNAAKGLIRDCLKLNGIIGRGWKFQLEEVLRKLNCFEQLRFGVTHLTASSHNAIIHSLIFKVFLNSSYYNGHVQYLLGRRTLGCVNLKETLYNIPQIHAITGGDLGIGPFKDSFEKSVHIISPKWWNKCTHFIEHTSKRPNIRFAIVWLVLPNFWARIIWGSCLSIK